MLKYKVIIILLITIFSLTISCKSENEEKAQSTKSEKKELSTEKKTDDQSSKQPSNSGTTEKSDGNSGSTVALQDSVRWVAKHCSPAVVNIRAETVVSYGKNRKQMKQSPLDDFLNDDLMEKFFGNPQPKNRKQQVLGSGFIISADGYIVTNNHVVEGASNISVYLPDKKSYEAKVIGIDEKSDISLIKIKPDNDISEFIDVNNTPSIQVGDFAIAIGNPFGLKGSVTFGVISALGRDDIDVDGGFKNYIQTDASINQGNSGGPLLNIDGKLIGVNTAIYSTTGGGSMGIGFAVPAEIVRKVVKELKETGTVQRGYLGVMVREINPKESTHLGIEVGEGVFVAEVQTGTPAEASGIQAGDVITDVDGEKIASPGELQRIIGSKSVDSKVKVKVLRGKGNVKSFEITVKKRDEGKLSFDKKGLNNELEKGDSEAFLGLTVGSIEQYKKHFGLSKDVKGVIVLEVKDDTPAQDSGLEAGDIIQSINYIDILSLEDFKKFVENNKNETSFMIRIKRNNDTKFVVLEKEKK